MNDLFFKQKIELAPNIWELRFFSKQKIDYIAGQYGNFLLSHPNSDDRGESRMFTLASSPTEPEIIITAKFKQDGSSFKKALLGLNPNEKLLLESVEGKFNLPQNQAEKICFVAGGIGITPFRSMLKFLLDTNQKRDIELIYCASNDQEFVYRDIFVNISTIYKIGRIDENFLKQKVPDYNSRTFYLSGPTAMVLADRQILQNLGLPGSQIITDYFEGY